MAKETARVLSSVYNICTCPAEHEGGVCCAGVGGGPQKGWWRSSLQLTSPDGRLTDSVSTSSTTITSRVLACELPMHNSQAYDMESCADATFPRSKSKVLDSHLHCCT